MFSFKATVCNGFPIEVLAERHGGDFEITDITSRTGRPVPFIEKKMTAKDWYDLEGRARVEYDDKLLEYHGR